MLSSASPSLRYYVKAVHFDIPYGGVFAMMAPWLVFGFLMAGIIAVWIPRSWVNRMMGGSSGGDGAQ